MATKVGASLRLQALANGIIAAFAAGDEGDDGCFELSVELAAAQLVALSAKSLEPGTGFALVNARQLVRQHHLATQERLKDAAAAEQAGRDPGRFSIAEVQVQAQRLKQLSYELRECGRRELHKVRGLLQAKRLCTMLKLGVDALAAYEAAAWRRGRAAAPGGSSPRRSPSPSPGRRGKRKTPERAAAGRSRFALAHGAAGSGVATADGDEPPRRRRSSSGEEGGAVLQPKQLFSCAGSASKGCSSSGGAGNSIAGTCPEWAAFKAFVASPRKAAAPGSPAAHGAQQLAQQDVQQDAQQAQQAENFDAMDVDSLCMAAQQCELGGSGGRGTPLSPSCQPLPPPPPQQQQAEQTTPARQMSSLLQLSPVAQCRARDAASASAGDGQWASAAPRPASRTLLQRHASPAAERAAAAAEILAADVMLLLSEDSGQHGGDLFGEGELQGGDSSMCDCSGENDWRGLQHDMPLPVLRPPQSGASPAPAARVLWVAGGRVLSCPAAALRRAAAEPAPHAGGGLDRESTFFNLDARGRAGSILRPMTAYLPPSVLAGAQQAGAAAGGAC